MKSIFEPFKIGSLTLKNRIVGAAVMQSFVGDENGIVTQAEADDLAAKAEGGAAMLITGMMGVGENSRALPQMLNVALDDFIRTYKPVVERVHEKGALLTAELANCGFKTGVIDKGDTAYAPSDIKNAREMSVDDIHRVTDEFARAALKCKECGIDAVELHAAHGYLLSEFLSPYVNHRMDNYGGAVENRARFLLEVIDAIREKTAKDYPILVKINGSDYIDGGFTKEDCLEVCKMMQARGVNAVEISGGISMGGGSAATRPGIKLNTQGSYVGEASYIAKQIDIPVICVCGFRTPEYIEKVLNETDIAAVSLARPLIREPNLVKRWENGDKSPSTCISCNMCFSATERGCPAIRRR